MEGGRQNPQQRDLFNIYAGDRLATVMAYLSEVSRHHCDDITLPNIPQVPMGGYTVFPYVGAFIPPVKVTFGDH